MAAALQGCESSINPLWRGECVFLGGTREPSFFLAVRKERSRHPVLLGDGGTAGESSAFDAFVPFSGGIPCRLFLSAFEALVLRVPSLMDVCRNQTGKTGQDQEC